MRIKRSDIISVVLVLLITGLVIKVAVPLPLSEKDREAQRLSNCLDNLRACAAAVQMYWNDYDGMLPSSVAGSKSATPTQADVVQFLTGKNPWPLPNNNSYTKPLSWAQILSPNFRRKTNVFCPSDTPGTRVSYWWKYAIDLAWRDTQNPARREGDYPEIDRQILLYEHASWHFGDAAGIKNGVKINVAFMDGHANTVTIKNGPASYPSADSERTGLASIRLGEPMYYNYNVTTGASATGEASFTDPRNCVDAF